VCRQLLIKALVLGLLASPATSSAVAFFHCSDPNGTVCVPLPLSVPPATLADLNLWMDPDAPSDDTIYAFDMDVKATGSLTFGFQRVEADFAGEDPNGVLGISGARQDGWETRFHVGTFELNDDGAVGDKIRLLGGHYTPGSWVEQDILPMVLAVVVPCGDEICSGGCGDVNDDGVFDADDPAALRLHLADPSAGVLTANGLASCAVIGDPVGCSIRQAVVMRRALQDPPLPPGLAPVCDCCIARLSPGCSDPNTESCVCDSDASCCNDDWDATCVSGVDGFDCGTCSATPPGP
jgi:hypothetical protein